MKRDMDLARRVLLELESAPFDGRDVKIDLEGVAHNTLQYHLLLLSEAGLIEAIDASSNDGPEYFPIRLTWSGHEFLDAARNDSFWVKAKSLIATKAGGVSFDIMVDVLKTLARQALFGDEGAV
jgi:hypothetical protein